MTEVTEEVLHALRLEVAELKNNYDEKLITGLRHLVLGQVDEASKLLPELATIDRQLTYIRSYLDSNYKQVVSLH